MDYYDAEEALSELSELVSDALSVLLELSEEAELSELSEEDELSELSELVSEELPESLLVTTEEEPLVLSPLPPQYTLMTLTASARTKKMIAATMVALLSIASFVLPAFFWKKLSEDDPEMDCDIWVLVSFIKITTTIKTQAAIRTIALIISNIPINYFFLQ